jgi:hypothetical protein
MRRPGQAITWPHVTLSARANGRMGGRFLGGSPVVPRTITAGCSSAARPRYPGARRPGVESGGQCRHVPTAPRRLTARCPAVYLLRCSPQRSSRSLTASLSMPSSLATCCRRARSPGLLGQLGLRITPGGSPRRSPALAGPYSRPTRRWSRGCGSPVVAPDETGWRVGGARAWLWAFVGAQVTVYRIAQGRGYQDAAAGARRGLHRDDRTRRLGALPALCPRDPPDVPGAPAAALPGAGCRHRAGAGPHPPRGAPPA